MCAPVMKLGRRSDKPFYAPLWAGGAAVLIVIGVLVYTNTRSIPTVAELPSPVVAADKGGFENYPANSREAFVEDLRFGFVPAMNLTALSDGTVVVADPADIETPLDSLSAEDFAKQSIPPAAKDQPAGTTLTWDQAREDFSSKAVTMATITDPAVADTVITDAKDAGITESLIIRSAEPEIVAKAAEAGFAALAVPAEPPADDAAITELLNLGATMVEVPAEGFVADGRATPQLQAVLDADLGVWLSGLDSEKSFQQAGEAGVTGAITGAPYELRPTRT